MNDNKRSQVEGCTPFFSIIIPVFNAEAYLGECLESILAQDFQDWEAVLVDDCSSDRSAVIAEEFASKDTRIKLFKSDNNSGRAYIPRMRAAHLAGGKYLVTIDADDKVSPDLLTQLYNKIISSGADLVIPEMWKWDESGINKLIPTDTFDSTKIWEGKDLVSHTLCGWDIPMCGFAILPEIYTGADQKLTEEDKISIFSDELLSRWLLFMCRKVTMCDAKYFYRQHSASITHVNLLRIIDSTLSTCDSLLRMTSTAFGEDSPTHIKAIENKFYACVDSLRLINKSKLKGHHQTEATQRIATAMQYMDTSILKGRVSPRYLAIMRLPMPIARMAFKIIDPIIRLKNGI